MSAETVRISLKSRKVYPVNMQRESMTTPGKALKKGIEYLGVDDREIFGPYETGCVNAGTLCYNVPMQKSKSGKIIKVKMKGAPLFNAHFIADDVADLYAHGAAALRWPDATGNGWDMALYDPQAVKPCVLYDELNGHAVVRQMAYGTRYFEGNRYAAGFAQEKPIQTSDYTIYLVSNQANVSSIVCPCFAEFYLRREGELAGNNFMLGCMATSEGLVYHPDSGIRGAWYVGGDKYASVRRIASSTPFPVGWHVRAHRMTLLRADVLDMVNGSIISIPWSDNSSVPELYDSFIFWMGEVCNPTNAHIGELAWELAEAIIYPEAHTESVMREKTNELRAKYAI